jgi:hypothetical protein
MQRRSGGVHPETHSRTLFEPAIKRTCDKLGYRSDNLPTLQATTVHCVLDTSLVVRSCSGRVSQLWSAGAACFVVTDLTTHLPSGPTVT